MYDRPVTVELGYSQIWKDPFSEPWEAEVQIDIGDKQEFAFVPLFIVDEENRTVRAALLGEKGSQIFVSFPPTNFGHTRFMADADRLMEIARLPVDAQR
jgi:hypothetical protein